MKERIQQLAARIDAFGVRERAMMFGAVMLVLLMALYTFLLDPMMLRQVKLRDQMSQERNQIAGISQEIADKAAQYAVDPDAPARKRIADLRTQIDLRLAALGQLQTGLVAPDRMPGLLENILKRNAGLKLVSLRTLPVINLNAPPEPEKKPEAAQKPQQKIGEAIAAGKTDALVQAMTGAAAPVDVKPALPPFLKGGGIYRHGVEIVVEGGYGDLVTYLAALESMQGNLFWDKAALRTDQYPNSTLTLTIYTMSLDPKWLNL
jgi:MSHA biogenesis protein MshJ